jgi:hypothetical protein
LLKFPPLVLVQDIDIFSFTKQHEPIPESTVNLPQTLSHPTSVLNSYSQLITHEVSDGGLATSTHRLAVNTGNDLSHSHNPLFKTSSKPIHLPKLDSFLSGLKPPGFTPWTQVLTQQEIQVYQRYNYRKFPPWELVPRGCSITDIKSHRIKRERFPGLQNDWSRFLVDVSILTAGSPYGKYMSVGVFALYTRAVTLVFVHGDAREVVVERVLRVTGGEAMGLVVAFLLCPLLIYKARGEMWRGITGRSVQEVPHAKFYF